MGVQDCGVPLRIKNAPKSFSITSYCKHNGFLEELFVERWMYSTPVPPNKRIKIVVQVGYNQANAVSFKVISLANSLYNPK
jgi:hypothetical protein